MITSVLNRRSQTLLFSLFVLIFFTLGLCVLHGLVGAVQTSAQSRNVDDIRQMDNFKGWIESYKADKSSNNVAFGKQLASSRESTVRRLMEQNPKALIENAVSVEEFRMLPPEVSKYVEEPVSFIGDFEVIVADMMVSSTEKLTRSRTDRFVILDGRRYPAVVYGRRLTMTTKLNIPLNGVMIDNKIVLSEAPYLNLNEPTDEIPVVDIGGKSETFTSQTELNNFVTEEVEWENRIGPYAFDRKNLADRPDTSWTEGTKRVLIIMVDFSDLPGVPADSNGELTEVRSQNVFSQEVGPFFSANSYTKTAVQFGAITPVTRLPQTLAYYALGSNYVQLLPDARVAARAAGYETNDYELDIVALNRGSYRWDNAAGRGYVGSKGIFLFGYFNSSLIAHELGHNFGAYHANSWLSSNGSVIGTGQSQEQGDPFDLMGSCYYAACHFNTKSKYDFNWLTETDVRTITADGIYRLAPEDVATTGIRALKVRKDATRDYWIEYRRAFQFFSGTQELLNGVTIRWGSPMSSTNLLDITPATGSLALQVGQNFLDQETGIGFKVEGLGGTEPESIDVRVKFNETCQSLLNQVPTVIEVPAVGGLLSRRIYNYSNCVINLPVNASETWITVLSSLNGEIRLIVQPNYDPTTRTGRIIVSGRELTVSQAPTSTACVPLPTGAVAWWKADGNARDQIGGNHGNIRNRIDFGQGKVGGAFLAKNNSFSKIVVPDSASLALGPSLTIEGWVRVDQLENASPIIFSRAPLSGVSDFQLYSSYSLRLAYYSNGKKGLSFQVGNAPDSNALFETLNIVPFDNWIGEYFHCAATLDDATGQMKLYINGSLLRQTVTNVRPYKNANPELFGIGIFEIPTPTMSTGPISGAIDELSLYNRALTQTEIQSIYSAGISSNGSAGKCLETAPTYSVAGRVITPSGQALRNATVTLTDTTGTRSTATTTSFGVYSFNQVTGSTGYTISVSSKRFRFAPRSLDVASNLANIDFVGLE
ncbi:hypothetical protein BH10ACI2_BH10ACI2_02610 [soil metagenome]